MSPCRNRGTVRDLKTNVVILGDNKKSMGDPDAEKNTNHKPI